MFFTLASLLVTVTSYSRVLGLKQLAWILMSWLETSSWLGWVSQRSVYHTKYQPQTDHHRRAISVSFQELWHVAYSSATPYMAWWIFLTHNNTLLWTVCDTVQLVCVSKLYPNLRSRNTLWQFTGSSQKFCSPLLWRHNGRDGVSYHQPNDCLLNRSFRRRSKKASTCASLDFVRGIHQWPVNSPYKWPVTRKMFPFDDVTMAIETSPDTDV